MTSFVQLWVYLSATPLFGLTATLAVYLLALLYYQRSGQAPWANPVLWTVTLLALLLTVSGTPYPSYFSGAQFIHFLLGPAVVALGWPMWQRRAELRRRVGALLLAALALLSLQILVSLLLRLACKLTCTLLPVPLELSLMAEHT